ncbi:MAG TPA: ACT domain-containing protein [Planctomycetota bacterium]|nr:ACT domain-containing protein [Planctomycetota bacterium]
MNYYAVLMAVGEDKPGLVDTISKFILDCGGNIEDSRMAILGGEFAMLILVTGQQQVIDRVIKGAPEAGERSGLAIQAKLTRAPSDAVKRGTIPYSIEAFSMDHPGIVQRVASYLAERKINIRALDTRLANAPITGLPLFSLHAIVDIPATQNLVEIRRGLENIAVQHNIDIEMKPAK